MAGHGRPWLAKPSLGWPLPIKAGDQIRRCPGAAGHGRPCWPYPALASHGQPWPAVVGHGRPWAAMAGHGQPFVAVACRGRSGLALDGPSLLRPALAMALAACGGGVEIWYATLSFRWTWDSRVDRLGVHILDTVWGPPSHFSFCGPETGSEIRTPFFGDTGAFGLEGRDPLGEHAGDPRSFSKSDFTSRLAMAGHGQRWLASASLGRCLLAMAGSGGP